MDFQGNEVKGKRKASQLSKKPLFKLLKKFESLFKKLEEDQKIILIQSEE